MEEKNQYRSSLVDLIDDKTYGRFDKRKCALFYGQYLGEAKKGESKRKRENKSRKRSRGMSWDMGSKIPRCKGQRAYFTERPDQIVQVLTNLILEPDHGAK